MTQIAFQHKMAAHCETGSLTASLNHAGLDISEPMVFGIGSGIFFGYFNTPSFPFPVFTVRSKPGSIRKNIAKLLGVKFRSSSYKDPVKAQKELDSLLEKNIPVTVQVDFFYMDYLAGHERVHNNMHFINIIGKTDTKYVISDSYFPQIAMLEEEMLVKARFAKGKMAPKGFMYYTEKVPEHVNYQECIIKSIKKAAHYMLKLPVPFIGVKGIYRFADKIVTWPKLARDTEHLSHEIMKIHIFLEDQGTGGGGFRFIYATFLRQAAEMLRSDELMKLSEQMMKIGDNWRNISLFTARIGKNRDLGPDKLKELSCMIRQRGDEEKEFFNTLLNFAKKFKY